MIIAIVGATGNLGRRLTDLALARGHEIRAISPSAEEEVPRPGVDFISASDEDGDVLVAAFTGADVAVLLFPASLGHPERYPTQIRRVLDAAIASKVRRVVGVVGSSGALTSRGEHLVDTDYFQETTRHYYQSVHASWDVYRSECELDWLAIVPAARMQVHMGERGTYRTRADGRLVVTDCNSMLYFDVSQISYGDCALAILDEIEKPRHSRVFLSVGY